MTRIISYSIFIDEVITLSFSYILGLEFGGSFIMKKKVAFICVHNSCRSQIAEAIAKLFASDVFESYSAGTEVKPQINQDAVRIMKKRYDMDMEKTQHPKLLVDIPEVDIVITMGCNVNCPFLPCRYKEDWNLDDPTGKSDEEFGRVIDNIFANINELSTRISKMNI